MSCEWYYRVFGLEFGPVPLNELKLLAEFGTISIGDEVRQDNSHAWLRAETISDLNLKAVEASTRGSAGRDDWYCKVSGEELGPLAFSELSSFAEQGHLTGTDEIKLGAGGKWRRIGSVGRLVAVLPFQKPLDQGAQAAVSTSPVNQSPSNTGSNDATTTPVTNRAVDQSGDFVTARHAHDAIERAARQLISCTLQQNSDPAWWGKFGGGEHGPVEFKQVFEWATSGRLRPTDLIHNGTSSQYAPAGELPGLFAAANIVQQAAELLKLAETGTATSGLSGAQKSSATNSSSQLMTSDATAVVSSMPQIAASAGLTERHPQEIRPASGGYSASTTSPASMPRPVHVPPKPLPRRSSGPSPLSTAIAKLREPAGMGAVAALVVMMLFVVWLRSDPPATAADIAQYKELKKLLTDLQAKRAANASDFADIKSRAEKLKSDFIPILEKEATPRFPAKQAILWAVRDELPRVLKRDLKVESQSEKNFAKRLDEAAELMGVN